VSDRVLVVIPTYNEAETLSKIVARVLASVPAAHILVVDDNSPDGTGRLADSLAGADPQIHVLHRAGKEGLGRAYIAGFRWALEAGYDVVVEMDADGSHQPEELPRLLRALAQADMVKGSRWMRGGSVVDWSMRREVLSRAANVWIMAAMNLPIHDATGGYNLFKAATLKRIDLDSIESKGYSFQVDMTRRVLENGGVVGEVPIEFHEREAGVAKMSGNIIQEALIQTAVWGYQRRSRQVKGWFSKARKVATQ
jgi:glycosyltransferase involved in cell wall biosynthesis